MVPTDLKRFLQPTAFKSGLFCIIICCLVWYSFGYNKPHFFAGVDARIFDAMFLIRGIEDTSGSIVIVNIDEKSLSEFGQWPWPRDVVAKLTDRIFEAEPVVVGFDIMFAEKDRTSPALLFRKYKDQLTLAEPVENNLLAAKNVLLDHDLLLGNAIRRGESVQGYMFLFREDFLKGQTGVPPIPSLDITIDIDTVKFSGLKMVNAYRPILNVPEVSTGTTEGFLNVFPDNSGTIRKVPLFIMMDNVPYPSLTFEMYRLANKVKEARLHVSSIETERYRSLLGVSLGHSFFPTDDYGQMAVNFRGPFNTFLYLSASDVLHGTESSILKNKYVLIGSSAAGVMDLVATPFSSRLPGVEVHANVLDNLIQNDPMVWETYTEIGITYSAIIIGGVAISASLVYLGPLIGLLLSLTVLFSVAAGNYFFLFLNNHLLGPSFILTSLAGVFITVTFFNYFFEGRRRIFIRRAFSHYLAPSVVNELLKSPDNLDLIVNNREVTILFCDIRGFTTLSEHCSPEELSRFLNTYFSLMTEIILKHKGMVDKYIGDAVMAVWGSPLNDPCHAINGVRAACEMVEVVEKNMTSLTLSGKPIQIGIGVNSGVVSAGNFGCARHFDYTVLGNNVNLASRVEQLTKMYPVNILITKFTAELLHAEMPYRFIDRVLVKGRNKHVDLFEPLNRNQFTPSSRSQEKKFKRAVTLYRSGKFEKALDCFDELTKESGDRLYDIYAKRCVRFLLEPPPANWQGGYNHRHNSDLIE